jgi:hypothetical protein
MSKFNSTVVKSKTKTTNLAGEVTSNLNELAFVSLLLTSFVNNQFYCSSEESLDELKSLLKRLILNLGEACLFARD